MKNMGAAAYWILKSQIVQSVPNDPTESELKGSYMKRWWEYAVVVSQAQLKPWIKTGVHRK